MSESGPTTACGPGNDVNIRVKFLILTRPTYGQLETPLPVVEPQEFFIHL
jgi:hypothetical protein